MEIQERLYSIDEFWEIALLPENEDKRLELINGVIVAMPPSSTENGVLAMWIGYLLLSFVALKHLGYVSGPDTGYRLGPNTVAQPDVGFISMARSGPVPSK